MNNTSTPVSPAVSRVVSRLASRSLGLAMCGALLLGPVHVATAATAPEATWAQTFDSSSVAAHVSAQGQDVVILAGGPPSRRLSDVTGALQEQLERSGTAGRVRVAGASKRSAGLDDAALIEREGAASAERFVVVRVDGGDAARATVSVYSADADALGGFSAARGDTIEPPTETSHGGDSVLAVLTTDDVLGDEGEAVAEYRRKRVVFDGALQVTATGNGSAVVSRKFSPTTGAGTPLENDEYYTYVGREDLAQEFRRRRAAKVGMTVGGSLLVFTGLTVMLAVPLAAVIRNGSSDCDAGFDATDAEMMAQQTCEADADATQRRKVRQGLGIGGALLGGGLVLTVVGGKMKAHTSTAAELQEMGDGYNRDLRKRLDVREVASVRVAPTAHREGGGVVLSGRF